MPLDGKLEVRAELPRAGSASFRRLFFSNDVRAVKGDTCEEKKVTFVSQRTNGTKLHKFGSVRSLLSCYRYGTNPNAS